MTAEERKQNKKEKRIKKALRSYRCRFLKNLIIWFVGIISSVLVFSLALIVALKFVPVTTLTGDKTDQYVSAELADQSVLDLLLGIDSYTVDDLPVVITMLEELKNSDVMEGKKVKDFVDIDTEKLKGVKITELGNVLQDAVEVTAKIDDFVNKEDLKAFGELELFDWTPVKEADLPVLENGAILDTEKYAPGVYYYQVSEGVYAPAFDSENRLVDGVSESQLVYANLFELPVLDVIEIFDKCIGRLEVVGLINALGNANIQEGDLIYDVLGGTTISSLGDIEEKLMNVRLDSVLPVYKEVGGTVTDNRQLYEILLSAVGKDYTEDTLIDVAKAFTLGDVNGEFNIENLTLSTAMKGMEGSDIANILEQATGESWSNITIAHIKGTVGKGFDIGNVKLSTVMGNSVDAMLENILLGACSDVTDFDDITINHLKATNGFNIKKVELSTVLGTLDNTLKQVLTQALNDTDGTLTIGDFDRGFNMNNVQLSTVMKKGDNNILNAILDKPGVTIGTLGQTINDLTLYEVYGSNVFVEITEETPAPTGALQFKENNGVYTMETTGATHYLKAGAGIWLLICFNASETIDANGRPISYAVAEDKTISSLNSGTGLTDSLINATIRQLVDAGIIAEAEVHEKIMNLKLSDVLRDPAGAIIGG